ncbi:AAA family ATPase [uncultured Desulfosarcina sp.]|uniref:ExeA family protein n=1 Tax=uncultured Desulfosarcina sp. TaxID=218289 RepID=UPI0029C99694|nr:AAA family ATPase [uncultured Desulfosarcina sp.]
MYETHFGLSGKPFSIVPNPEILFLSKNHENALTYLEYGLSEKVGFILLTGEIGTGKTTLVRCMLRQMEPQMDIAVIFNTNFSSDQLFRLILKEFDLNGDPAGKEENLERIYTFLIDRYAKGRHALLVIDEAQNLSAEALEDIRMLSNLQTDDRMLLQIMLVGQPELKTRLQRPDLRQLAQRIAVNYHLTPLDEEQTSRYIAHRLESVGGQSDLFSREAVRIIHEHSGGIPRTVNLLCDSAMVYAYSDDCGQIDAAVIEAVVRDNPILKAQYNESEASPPSKSETYATDGPSERMAAIEAALSELRDRHDALDREVRQELIAGYRQRLVAERKRYDRLMAKYTLLLQRVQSKNREERVLRQKDVSANPREKRENEAGPHWKGMIGRVLKGRADS